MEYINDSPISKELNYEIKKFIEKEITNYDVVLVNDFGHGFLNDELIETIEKKAKFLAINVQTNSSNFGFNLIEKYSRADFLSTNHGEIKLLFHTKEEKYVDLLKKLAKKGKYNKILLTLGKKGTVYFDGKSINKYSAQTTTPVDTVGAGDAVFSITALLSFINSNSKTISELANIIGAIIVKTVGNKDSLKKEDFKEYLK